jgi:ribosome-binding ATPase YchF (GTP1/OBG family)
MDDINNKMSKAAKNREANLAKQISDVKENLDKVSLALERRNSEDRLSGTKNAIRISDRIAAADEKRLVQISSISDYARNHNQRVSTRVATHTTGITEGVKTLQVQIEEKLKKAAEKREANLAKQMSGVKEGLNKVSLVR